MGPGGEVATGALLAAKKRVAVIERELIGGECAFWACIPSKVLLRSPEVRADAAKTEGVATPGLEWPATAAYRDEAINHLDDEGSVRDYEQQGATVFKGVGCITGRGAVEVNGQMLHADHIIIATGSDSAIPPIKGLDTVPYWTNREATTLREIPRRVVIVGGGPVAIELGQMLARFGSHVTLVQSADRLINREDERVSALIADALATDGITIHTGREAKAARRNGDTTIVTLDNGGELAADALIIATGRIPRVQGIGLESLAIAPDEKTGVRVDEHCRVTEGVYAVGDVTNIAPFTHVAQYQGRVAAANILGAPTRADYRVIPRVVYSDPEIAAVGLTAAQAEKQGMHIVTAEVNMAETLARPKTYGRNVRGTLGLVADKERGVLVGAWAVAPLAGEWLQMASIALRAEIPLTTLRDTMFQFPTFAEALWYGVDKLSSK